MIRTRSWESLTAFLETGMNIRLNFEKWVKICQKKKVDQSSRNAYTDMKEKAFCWGNTRLNGIIVAQSRWKIAVGDKIGQGQALWIPGFLGGAYYINVILHFYILKLKYLFYVYT